LTLGLCGVVFTQVLIDRILGLESGLVFRLLAHPSLRRQTSLKGQHSSLLVLQSFQIAHTTLKNPPDSPKKLKSGPKEPDFSFLRRLNFVWVTSNMKIRNMSRGFSWDRKVFGHESVMAIKHLFPI
jgi:hypothetical protein